MINEVKEVIEQFDGVDVKENKSNFAVTFYNKPIITLTEKKKQGVWVVKNNLEKEEFELEEFDEETFEALVDYCIQINTPDYWELDEDTLKTISINGYNLFSRGKSDDFIIRENMKSRVYKKANVQATDRWLDVGGNIGMFCVYLHSVGCDNVVSFEPEGINFKLMEKNLAENGITKPTLIQEAVVGDDSETVSFFMGTTPYDYSLIKKNSRKKEIKVDASNINEIIEKYDIDCLKLDCEGAEYELIKAITPENFGRIRKLVGEYHFDFLDDVGVGTKYFEVLDILKTHFSNVEATEDVKQLWNTNFFALK